MNKKLFVFIVVTCLFSWACWLPIIDSLESSPFESSASVLFLFFLGAYGPSLAGIALTYFYDKREGLSRLFKRTRPSSAGARWAVLCVLTGPLIYATSVGTYAAIGGDVGSVNYGLLPWLPVLFIVPVVFGPLAEEFGWRGFALPLLDHKNKAITSSIVIGFIWALWHAPLFWAKTGTAISGFPVEIASVSLFFLAVIGSSFVYTWVFNNTAGSVFTAILLHLSMNASGTITGMLFPEMSVEQKLELYYCYVVVVWTIVLAGALLKFGRQRSTARRSVLETSRPVR